MKASMNRIERTVVRYVARQFGNRTIRILELCPGAGHLTRALIAEGYSSIEALDIDPDAFDVPEVTCHKGNLSDPQPFSDGSFDLVICCEGIEHLEHQYAFVKECNRVLAPGGSLVLSTPNGTNFASRLRFLMTGFYALSTRPNNEFSKNWYVEHIYPLTFWQLRHILHTRGFLIRELFTDHFRKSALVGVPLWPLVYLLTWLALAKESDPRQLEVNRQICAQMCGPVLYLGRTMVVHAVKESPASLP